MGVYFEIDIDEFIELMECETQARRRVAEIIERRRQALLREDPKRDRDKDYGTTH